LNLGYLSSAILFTVAIFIPACAHWRAGLNAIAAFWMSYVLTRPLGASYADYISKPRSVSGIDFGNGQTTLVSALAVLVLVSFLAIAAPDIQPSRGSTARAGTSADAPPEPLMREPKPGTE
jgi:uncharacterized membrane-anchored protein